MQQHLPLFFLFWWLTSTQYRRRLMALLLIPFHCWSSFQLCVTFKVLHRAVLHQLQVSGQNCVLKSRHLNLLLLNSCIFRHHNIKKTRACKPFFRYRPALMWKLGFADVDCWICSPFLRRLGISIFGFRMLSHGQVSLHGDTAGSRAVCSLLLDSSRKTRTRIKGCLRDVIVS